MVFSSALGFASSARGAGVAIVGPGMAAGSGGAVETLTVFNSGSVPLSSFTVSTQGASAGQYCVTILDPPGMSVLRSTCPALSPDPGTVPVSWEIPPGSSVVVELYISGGSISAGSQVELAVTAASGASATAEVQVLPE